MKAGLNFSSSAFDVTPTDLQNTQKDLPDAPARLKLDYSNSATSAHANDRKNFLAKNNLKTAQQLTIQQNDLIRNDVATVIKNALDQGNLDSLSLNGLKLGHTQITKALQAVLEHPGSLTSELDLRNLNWHVNTDKNLNAGYPSQTAVKTLTEVITRGLAQKIILSKQDFDPSIALALDAIDTARAADGGVPKVIQWSRPDTARSASQFVLQQPGSQPVNVMNSAAVYENCPTISVAEWRDARQPNTSLSTEKRETIARLQADATSGGTAFLAEGTLYFSSFPQEFKINPFELATHSFTNIQDLTGYLVGKRTILDGSHDRYSSLNSASHAERNPSECLDLLSNMGIEFVIVENTKLAKPVPYFQPASARQHAIGTLEDAIEALRIARIPNQRTVPFTSEVRQSLEHYLQDPALQADAKATLGAALAAEFNTAIEQKLLNDINPSDKLTEICFRKMPLAQVTTLINAGANLEVLAERGYKANGLTMALQRQVLVKRQQDNPDDKVDIKINPDEIAPVIAAMVKAGISAGYQEPTTGNSPLHDAVSMYIAPMKYCAPLAFLPDGYFKPSTEILAALLSGGAETAIKNKEGMTPLHFAARYDDEEACLAFMSGPLYQPGLLNTAGENALYTAIKHGNRKAAQVINTTADQALICSDNPSQLNLVHHIACEAKNDWLSFIGTDPAILSTINIPDRDGRPAFWEMFPSKYDTRRSPADVKAMLDFFVQRSALDFNATSTKGKTFHEEFSYSPEQRNLFDQYKSFAPN